VLIIIQRYKLFLTYTNTLYRKLLTICNCLIVKMLQYCFFKQFNSASQYIPQFSLGILELNCFSILQVLQIFIDYYFIHFSFYIVFIGNSIKFYIIIITVTIFNEIIYFCFLETVHTAKTCFRFKMLFTIEF
jgi:hypothetical protein